MSDMERAAHQFVPVIVGDKHGLRTARRLYWQHGLFSHVLCPHISFFRRLTPWLLCHELPATPALTVLALRDLAAEIEAADRTPLLYLCSDAPLLGAALLDELEDCYIICRDGGDLTRYDQGGQAI